MSADAIVSYALSLEGLSYSATRDRYAALLFPHDTPAQAKQMASSLMSCGLTCEAILRGSEVEGAIRWRGQQLDGLGISYAARLATSCTAVVYQQELGRQRGLWVTPTPDKRPDAGDMLTVLGPEHVMTVTGVDGDELEVIEGGQIDAGNSGKCTAIFLHKKRLVVRNGAMWCVPASTPNAVGRKVYGWLQAGNLACIT